jgi:hypothetical protein
MLCKGFGTRTILEEKITGFAKSGFAIGINVRDQVFPATAVRAHDHVAIKQ